MTYHTRSWRSGDETELMALFETCFGKPASRNDPERLWKWIHLERPLQSIRHRLAEKDNRIVAQYEVGPLEAVINGQSVRAALSYGTMTHPDHRRKGLFARLAKELYKELTADGFVFTYGFPNQFSAHGFFETLGWHNLSPLPVVVRPSVFGSLRLLSGAGGRSVDKVNYVATTAQSSRDSMVAAGESLPDDVDELWNRCRSQYRITITRNRSYLQWRYIQHPDQRYLIWTIRSRKRLVGLAVTATKQTPNFPILNRSVPLMFLCEFLVDKSAPEAGDILLDKIALSTSQFGAVGITALAGPDKESRRFFLRKFFLPIPMSFFPKAISFGVHVHDKSLEIILKNRENWHLTWGDLDVI